MPSARSDRSVLRTIPEKVRNSAFLLTGMLIISLSAFPQFQKLDSLKALLKDAKANKKADLLNEIAILLPDEEKLIYFDQVISEATDSVILARAIGNKGITLYRLGKMDEASQMLEDAIPIFEKIKGADYYLESMYSILAKIYMFTGRYSSSLKLFYDNLRLANNLNDSLLIGYQLLDMGIVYYKIRDNESALKFYSDALNFVEGDSSIQFLAYMNSSLCLSELGLPGLAISYCNLALPFANGREKNFLHFEFAVGFAQLKLGCIDEAIEMFKSSLTRSIMIGDARMHADNLLYLSKSWLAKSVLDSCYNALSHAEQIADEKQFKEILLDIYRSYIQIANIQRDHFRLVAYQRKYIELKQELYNIELEKGLASLEGDWYRHNNELIINFQRIEMDERREALTYQEWISATLYLLGLLIISIIVLYLRGLHFQRQSQRFLRDQVESRFDKLKEDGLCLTEHGADGVSNKALELDGRIKNICDQMKSMLDKHPEVLGIDSNVKHFEEVASAYSKMNEGSKVLLLKNG